MQPYSLLIPTLRQALIDITDVAHDDSQFRFSRTVVEVLNKFVFCYHLLYRLGLYYHEGWGGSRNLAVGKGYWGEAKEELERILKVEEHPLVAFDLGTFSPTQFLVSSSPSFPRSCSTDARDFLQLLWVFRYGS